MKFIDYLKQLPDYKKCVFNHEDYLSWANVNFKVETQFFEVGEIDIKGTNHSIVQYSGNETSVVFDDYPYHGCKIYACKRCKSLFFYYLEQGYHYPQDRFRLIRNEIIDNQQLLLVENVILDFYLNRERTIFEKMKNVFKRN